MWELTIFALSFAIAFALGVTPALWLIRWENKKAEQQRLHRLRIQAQNEAQEQRAQEIFDDLEYRVNQNKGES